MNARRLERTIFLGMPAGVLLVAFAGICVTTGSAWPWNEVVHEDGHRTLLGTIFFFEHATRELVPDTLLAIAVAGAVRYYFPPLGGVHDAPRRIRLALVWLLTGLVIVGGTVYTDGTQAVLDNLAQLHTREGAPLVWGAHWRYHLIDRFAEMMLAFCVSGIVLRLTPYGLRLTSHGARFRLFGIAMGLFAVFTIVFRPTTEPFEDPAFLGHQLRELFTHALVTVPLALSVCFSLTPDLEPGTLNLEPRTSNLEPRRTWPIAVSGGLAITSGAFLLVASVMTGAQSHGQTTGLAPLLLPHFFEHSLGYVFVPALAGWLYSSAAVLEAGPQSSTT